MRTAAQIHPRPLLVHRDHFTLRQRFDNLHLIVLAQVPKLCNRVLAAHFESLNGEISLNNISHTLFDGVKVFATETMPRGKIVIETILDGRSNSDLSTGIQLLHRHSQQVGR